MGRFDNARALAKRLIDKNGEQVTLRTFAPSAVDPAQPWKRVDGATPTDTPLKAVFLPLPSGGATVYADGSQARVGDKQILIAAGAGVPTPDLNSKIIRSSGEIWSVVDPGEFDPDGTAIIYDVRGRK